MRTKLLTLLLCLLTTLPALADYFEVDGIYYIHYTGDNTVCVKGYPNERYYRGSITIPAEVQYAGKTYSVTGIGGFAFRDCTGLTSITLPNSITYIGESAFRDCTGLTSITLPNSITDIDYYAFGGCTGLTSITLPNSITSIGKMAFVYCSSLTQIEVDNDNKAYCSIDGVLFSKNKTTIITYPAGKSNSNQYIIPNSVTYISECAFYGCTGLTSITLPNSIKSIGSGAFSYCTGLTSITLPNSITSIDFCTFYGCTGLTEIYCAAEVPPICGNDTFWSVNCTNCKLYVPMGAVEAYRTTDPWSLFNIVGYDFAGVAEVSSVSPAVAYDLQGRRVSNPRRGIFIVNGQKQRLN